MYNLAVGTMERTEAMSEQQDPLKVENGMDFLILLLYAPGTDGQPGAPIEGITRFQKLMFLLQQDVGPSQLVKEAASYDYEPYKMGPYSAGVRDDLEELVSAGVVTTERLHYWLADDSDDPGNTDPDVDAPSKKRKAVESSR